MSVAKRVAARSRSRFTWDVVQLGEGGPLVAFDGRIHRPDPAPEPEPSAPLPTAPPAHPWLEPGEHWVEPSARLVAVHCEAPGRCCLRCGGKGCKACLLLGHGVEVLALGRHLARRGAELVEAGLVTREEAGLGPAEEAASVPESKARAKAEGQLSFW